MKVPPIALVPSGKKWPQYLAAMSATVAVFTTGFHTGWPAPSLPKLLSDEYPLEVTNDEASYITIIAHLGNLFGGLVGTTLLDRIGRRRTILLIALPQVISFVLIVMSYQLMELLYVARFIGGIAEGMTFTIIPLYVAEIAEPTIRGTLGTFIAVSCIFGLVYVNIVGSYLSIRITAATFLVFPLIFLVLFWRMPESPYYLVMKNQQKQAEESLRFLRRKSSVSEELSVLVKDVKRQMSESGTFRDIFTINSNRKAFILIVGARLVQQFTGVSAFALYMQILLKEATDSLTPEVGATVLLLVQLTMAVLSTFFVDKWGRKPLLLFSTVGCFLNLSIQAIYFALKEYTSVDVTIIDWFPLVMMILFIILFSTGLGVVVQILSSEIFSASVKGKSICLANIAFALGMMSSTKFYQATADGFGLTVPFSSYALVTLLGSVFLYFCVPETKGKSLEEIQQYLKGNKVALATDGVNFAYCNIDILENRTFYYHNHLRELHLDNNDLKTFSSGLFSEGNDLRILSVMHNHISRIPSDAFSELVKLKELDLRGNKIAEIKREVLAPLKNLADLHLQNNQIRYITGSTFPPLPLRSLSLMANNIDSLERGAFAMMPSLSHLYLSNNRLSLLKNGTFLNLTHLLVLTLDDNFIKTIELGVFIDVPRLTSLRVVGNQFRSLDKKVLKPLTNLKHIYFDRFELCESALHVRLCYPKGDGISSHEHLLDNPLLRASVWIMGTIGCTGNLIVLLGRFLAPSNNVVHSLYLRNLALSDLLMGVYLFAIAVADHHYRGDYLRYQYKWRHSDMCSLCGFLSTLSCESSVLILTLVTWDRFVSVTQPLARKQPSPTAAALTLVVLWTLAAAVALAPFSKGYFGDEFYGNNGVCLPLHIHEPYAMGWEYSATMFMLVNALALAFICYAYLRMINEIKASGVACRSTRQSQERDKVAQRFGIIVLTDCLCWVPVIVVKLVALSGYPIPQDLYAWLAIFVLPINSALNPVLYTLTTTMFKKQMRKIINSCVRKRRRGEVQHSASESGFSLSFGVFPKGGSTRRILTYRGTQNSMMMTQSSLTSKNSWKRPTAV